MRVEGFQDSDRPAFTTTLQHGGDPEQIAYAEGFRVLRPLSALRDRDGELVLRLSVTPAGDHTAPAPRSRGRDRGLKLGGVAPERRQRAAAYAVVLSDRGLLCTEYSDKTAVAGRWGMPGGGIDDDEEPAAAVLREIVEETSQSVQLGELCRIQTSHWVGRSPHGPIEDFHAVRLIYRGTCAAPTDPVVLDQGGTTESARWVPLGQWTSLTWTQNWRTVLTELLG